MKPILPCVATAILCVLTSCAPPTSPRNIAADKFRLSVALPSGKTITAKLQSDHTFGATAVGDSGAAYAIGGMMLPPEGQSIALVLTVVEYRPNAGQVGVVQFTYKVNLVIDQPQSLGSYTVSLNRVNSELP